MKIAKRMNLKILYQLSHQGSPSVLSTDTKMVTVYDDRYVNLMVIISKYMYISDHHIIHMYMCIYTHTYLGSAIRLYYFIGKF